MTTKIKLELTWPGKHKRPRLEPRILLEDKALSYHAASHSLPDLVDQAAGAAAPAFDDNLLIHGDNLLALKALESKYAGKVKCVFIDPPYNTGSAFTHYDDGVEHSLWLTLIRDRLEIIRTARSQRAPGNERKSKIDVALQQSESARADMSVKQGCQQRLPKLSVALCAGFTPSASGNPQQNACTEPDNRVWYDLTLVAEHRAG